MRTSVSGSAIAFAITGAFLVQIASAATTAGVHPVEAELRRSFPAVAIESAATFEPADMLVHGMLASGLRSRFASHKNQGESRLQVLYPRSYDGMIVVESGDQRVVLRATGASGSQAVETNGKLVYGSPYASTDAIEVPRAGGAGPTGPCF